MAKHDAHHFVPAFILRQWQTAADGKLSAFRWINGKLVHQRYRAKSVAKEIGLYSLRDQASIRDNVIEREFFGRVIDDPSSVVHRRILEEGLQALSADERFVWGRFIVAQMLRAPRMVAYLKERGSEIFKRTFEADPEEYEAANQGESQRQTLTEWIEHNAGALSTDNLSIASLPEVVDSELLHDTIRRSHWGTAKIGPRAPYDLLIGDHPLLYVGTMETTFVLLMPIAPRMAFLAYNNHETRRRIENLPTRQLVRDINFTTVASASEYVYATGTEQTIFIERYLKRPE